MRRTALLLAKVGVTLLLLWLVGQRLDMHTIAARLQAMRPLPLAVAFLLVAGQTLILVGWRWQQVLRLLGVETPLRRPVALVMLGHFINQALPATLGGDAVRIWLLSREMPRPGIALFSVVIERLIGMVGLLLLALPGVPWLLYLTGGDLRGLTGAGLVLGFFCLIFVPALLIGRWPWLRAQAEGRGFGGLIAATRTVVADRNMALVLLVSSALGHAANCAAIWLIAQGYGVSLGLIEALALIPTVFVILMVPVSFGGWGVREGAMVLSLGLVDVPAADALLLSVTFGLVGMATAAPGLLVWLLTRLPLRRDASFAGR